MAVEVQFLECSDAYRRAWEELQNHIFQAFGVPAHLLMVGVRMDEQEWLTSNDPARMLTAVPDFSPRKLRLFTCALCRQVWDGETCWECGGTGTNETDTGGNYWQRPCEHCHGTGCVGGLTDPRSRNAVEVAERHADGEATGRELDVALCGAVAAWVATQTPRYSGAEHNAAGMARYAASVNLSNAVQQITRPNLIGVPSPATQAALLRCIVGNPFRPVTLPVVRRCIKCGWDGTGPNRKYCDRPQTFDGKVPHLWRASCPWLTHNDGAVPKLAQAIYDSRHWDELPILADALEEAGADDSQILDHLRGPGPHARGCWCIDLLLGKE